MNDDDKVIDIADLRRDKEKVWQCKCGTYSFFVHGNGRLQCCGCEAFQITNKGHWYIPEPCEAKVTAFPAPSAARSEEF